jgi:hypothetical protein
MPSPRMLTPRYARGCPMVCAESPAPDSLILAKNNGCERAPSGCKMGGNGSANRPRNYAKERHETLRRTCRLLNRATGHVDRGHRGERAAGPRGNGEMRPQGARPRRAVASSTAMS